MTEWQAVLFGVYAACIAVLALHGLHGFVMLALFRLTQRRARARHRARFDDFLASMEGREAEAWPRVTTQLPMFNEADVAERVIRAAAAMRYPAGRHQVQVLDDSTDDTRAVVDRVAAELRESGVDIEVLRRDDRTGYKAGALRAGMDSASGGLLAIFDADFVPSADFLERAVALMVEDERIACVQGRWTHLNPNHSWLTRAQAAGIDGHFAVEQGARAWGGLYMNFNGTAGMWRREAIRDAGGWQADTITEDLDLSYRAQLAGWRMVYAFDLTCPAELPDTVPAFKSQQRRWAKGSMQTARKLLPRIWRARGVGLHRKLGATLHLTHFSVSVLMIVLALLTLPVLTLVPLREFTRELWAVWLVVLAAAMAPVFTYVSAGIAVGRPWFALRQVPALIMLGGGLSVNNGFAAMAGLFGRDTTFIRTPKSGADFGERRKSRYRAESSQWWWLETLMGVYCAAGLAVYINTQSWLVGIYLTAYALGFLALGLGSRPRRADGANATTTDRVANSAVVAPATEHTVEHDEAVPARAACGTPAAEPDPINELAAETAPETTATIT